MVTQYQYDELMSKADLDELILMMEWTLRNAKDANCDVPQRSMIYKEDGRAAYFSMPAFSTDLQLFITKIATFKERAANDQFPSITSLVVAFEGINGQLLALLDGSAVTNIKCAALAALVTRHCSEDKPHHLAVLGSGTQARQQLWGMSTVRNIQRLTLWSRSHNNAHALAEEARIKWLPNCDIRVVCEPEEALREATLISTTTSSCQPIATFRKLLPGVHINCMGAHTPQSRELPRSVLEQATLIVENRCTACAEAGDLHQSALEVSELVNGPTHFHDSTVFSSTGYAVFDLITTAYLLSKLPKLI